MNILVFTADQIQQIRTEGESAYPNECCGAFIGHQDGEHRVVDRLRPLSNSFEPGEQFHRFRLDPMELAQVEKEAGGKGQLVLGFYHSHPNHPARPSEYDREHAWPFYSYVIIAIENGEAAIMTSWQLNETTEQFESQEILLAEDEDSITEEIERKQ